MIIKSMSRKESTFAQLVGYALQLRDAHAAQIGRVPDHVQGWRVGPIGWLVSQ